MSRPKKKNSNPAFSMEVLLARAVEAYVEPYDDRDERDPTLPSLRTVAEELNTTILRVRKLLITAEYYSTFTSRLVQDLSASGYTVEAIMEKTGLGKASVNSYLSYKKFAFKLDQTTVNADRHRVFRKRMKAVSNLLAHMDLPDEMEYLWKVIVAFEGYAFKTFGRGSREGLKFYYTVSRKPSAGGRHYKGASIDGYGNELWITTLPDKVEKAKTISRCTVEYGYKKARELKTVENPKALGLPGTGSYLYPVFLRLGVCEKA